jgi:hypothetical protein
VSQKRERIVLFIFPLANRGKSRFSSEPQFMCTATPRAAPPPLRLDRKFHAEWGNELEIRSHKWVMDVIL